MPKLNLKTQTKTEGDRSHMFSVLCVIVILFCSQGAGRGGCGYVLSWFKYCPGSFVQVLSVEGGMFSRYNPGGRVHPVQVLAGRGGTLTK